MDLAAMPLLLFQHERKPKATEERELKCQSPIHRRLFVLPTHRLNLGMLLVKK